MFIFLIGKKIWIAVFLLIKLKTQIWHNFTIFGKNYWKHTFGGRGPDIENEFVVYIVTQLCFVLVDFCLFVCFVFNASCSYAILYAEADISFIIILIFSFIFIMIFYTIISKA